MHTSEIIIVTVVTLVTTRPRLLPEVTIMVTDTTYSIHVGDRYAVSTDTCRYITYLYTCSKLVAVIPPVDSVFLFYINDDFVYTVMVGMVITFWEVLLRVEFRIPVLCVVVRCTFIMVHHFFRCF